MAAYIELFAALWALYLWECLHFPRPGVWMFVRVLLKRPRQLRRILKGFGGSSGGFFVALPWCPRLPAESIGIVPRRDMQSVWLLDGYRPVVEVAVAELEGARLDGKEIRFTNGAVWRASSPAMARNRLANLRKITEQNARTTLNKMWTRSLRPRQVVLSRSLARWDVFGVNLQATLLYILWFIALPAVVFLYGPNFLALKIAVVAQLASIFAALSLLFGGWRLAPDLKWQWVLEALVCAILPFRAARAPDRIGEVVLRNCDPLAVSIQSGDSAVSQMMDALRHLVAESADTASAEVRDFLMPHFVQAFSRSGRDLIAMLAEKPEAKMRYTSDAAKYCPSCHATFIESITTCSDCVGVKTKELK